MKQERVDAPGEDSTPVAREDSAEDLADVVEVDGVTREVADTMETGAMVTGVMAIEASILKGGLVAAAAAAASTGTAAEVVVVAADTQATETIGARVDTATAVHPTVTDTTAMGDLDQWNPSQLKLLALDGSDQCRFTSQVQCAAAVVVQLRGRNLPGSG
ncbi:uncharacterized protein [Cebidichthys violaceus]|uniref:uncharacterized protein isoform X4 n=1 Tax=Cebidichthys violaceus TaxID=271503 RepID=UPI0035CC595F